MDDERPVRILKKYGRIPEEIKQASIRLFHEGYKMEDIASRLEISSASVSRFVRDEQGYGPRSAPTRVKTNSQHPFNILKDREEGQPSPNFDRLVDIVADLEYRVASLEFMLDQPKMPYRRY